MSTLEQRVSDLEARLDKAIGAKELDFVIGLTHGVREVLEIFIKDVAKDDPETIALFAAKLRNAIPSLRPSDAYRGTVATILESVAASLTRTEAEKDFIDERVAEIRNQRTEDRAPDA